MLAGNVSTDMIDRQTSAGDCLVLRNSTTRGCRPVALPLYETVTSKEYGPIHGVGVAVGTLFA